jgi:nucleoside-diphosphate-sugar epimerase
MDHNAKVCAVTGASGYLGSKVVQYFREKGWKVLEVGSRGEVRFRLGDELDERVWRDRGVQALVHCAYDFSPRDSKQIRAVNVEGTKKLFNSALAGGVRRIIFVSSMAAYEGCRSHYGQAKLEIEAECARIGAAVVRPGLIYGEVPGGMVGMLNRLMDRSVVLPLIGSGREVLYLSHETDICSLLERLASATNVSSQPITAAHGRGMEFRSILQELASRKGKKVAFFPIPATFVWAGLKMAEILKLPIQMRSDSVVSLRNQNPKPSFQELQEIGMPFRDFMAPQLLGES